MLYAALNGVSKTGLIGLNGLDELDGLIGLNGLDELEGGLAERKGALSIPQASSTSAKLDASVLILQTSHDNNDSDDDEKVI